jgi:hypothetical protein
VAVSIYFPQAAGNETCHQTGLETSYIAPGDVSGNASLPGANTTGDFHFLMNLDVQNSAAAGAVVTLGASITCGVASAQDANRKWPDDLAVRLKNAGYTVGVINQGISGNQLLVDGSGQSALHRFQRDVVAQAGVRWVVFADDPINDLGDSIRPAISSSPAPCSSWGWRTRPASSSSARRSLPFRAPATGARPRRWAASSTTRS